MRKVGFIVKNIKKVKDKEYEYFYLRRSDRLKSENHKRKKKDTNLYSFGNKNKALKTINDWERNINNLPLSLVEMGYSIEDVRTWKEQIINK